MKDYIAQHAEGVLDYGPIILGAAIVICLWIIYRIGRKQRYFIPKTISGWLGFITCLLFISLFSLIIVGLSQERRTTGKVLDQFESMVDAPAPKLSFKSVKDDEKGELSQYGGKVVLISFWATWCQPCIKEMPELVRLRQEYARKGLEIILLSDESRERLLSFDSVDTSMLVSVYNEQIEWLEMSLGTARPLSIIVDRQGVIRAYFTGARDFNFLSEELAPYF